MHDNASLTDCHLLNFMYLCRHKYIFWNQILINMRKLILTLFIILLISPVAIYAQQTKTVKGTVLDETGLPVIGATVKVNGTNIGTVTDLDGNYELANVPENATISYSFIGMQSQEIKAAGQSVIAVTLREDTQNLEEVVVIGYGSAKAKDLTAPIMVVKGDEIVSQPTASPMAALQGKVPGVNIVNSGTPGSGPTVKVRGVGSFSDSTPLYVVDGMFYDNINFLNNADIQEMSILKDASAAAIYGVRAANGVVIITTKKGRRNQKAQITYNGYVGVQVATNVLEMTNSSEYAQMLREAGEDIYSSYLQSSINKYGGDYATNRYNADTDWYDELIRPAVMTNHSLSISGGSENATYSVGMSYLSQDGIMDVENYYRRMNFRAALDYDATNWLKVGFNAVFSNGKQKLPNNAAWQQAYNMPGIIPVWDTTVSNPVYASPQDLGVSSNLYNPVATANFYDSKNDTYQVLSNFFAQVNIIPDKLNIRTSYSYDYSLIKGRTFTPVYNISSWQKNETTSLTKSDTNYYKSIWDNTITYNEKWGDHKFGAMVGHSMRRENYRYLWGNAANVPEGADEYLYLVNGNTEGRTLGDDGWTYNGLSYFARLNYDYAGKYLLMFTMRADGSSKYQEKWGYFPSVGAAWVMTEENFMENQNVFDYFKLRASWGRLGNDKVAASDGFASITTGNDASGVFGNGAGGPGVLIPGWQNATYFSWLKWEVVDETNVGFNFSTLKNRLDVDFDWYYRLTDNAVVSPTIPMTNYGVAKNTGEILNTGVDLSINWHDKVGDFSYYVGANLAYLHNEVKSLDGNLQMIKGGKTVNMVGEKMNSYYGFKVAGVYQNQAEINADPIALENGLEPGDLRYEDVNGDHKIDGDDRQILGSYVPDFTYGFNIGFSYKNFDFALTTYGQVGGELWNRKRSLRYADSHYNFDKDTYENRWHGEGTSNTHPSAKGLTKGWNISDQKISSYFVEKSDYFRIQNITLGYSFKNIKFGNYTMPGIRLSLTADRPFSTFKANSFTPELSDPEGWDTEVYPLTATYTFGVQIDF